MKAGQPISDLAAQVYKEAKSKKDYVALTSAISLITVPRANAAPDVGLQFNVNGESRLYTPTNVCLGQIASRTGIPATYAERMRTQAPELLVQNVNHWFKANPEPRMLRTLDNGVKIARAFLGDGYRPFDNYDLFTAIVPHLEANGVVIRSAQITDTRFYIKASTPRISRPINQVLNISGKETRVRTVEAGVIISNSEVGFGSISVDPMGL
jgi:hypothetical protein